MEIEQTNGRKFLVGNSQFHFLKGGVCYPRKMKRKFGKCVPPSSKEERSQEAREGCGTRIVSVSVDQQWSGAASLITEDSGAAGEAGEAGRRLHITMCLEWWLSQGENIWDSWFLM